MLDAGALIAKHKGKGVLIDVNLLVLWLIGSVSRKYVGNHKRTDGFTLEDFERLLNLVDHFGPPVVVTPHVLSQVSDLAILSGRDGVDYGSCLSF